MLEFDNGEYESVCIFAEKTDDRDGWICLEGPGGKEQQVHMNDDWYRLVQLALPEKGIYRISRKGVSFTQMYLSGGPDLMDKAGKSGIYRLYRKDIRTAVMKWNWENGMILL